MTDADFYVGKPIRSLQLMLRTIAKSENRPLPVVPDGIYGQDTVQAVSSFQAAHQLPVTGRTDNRTWNAIADTYAKQAPLVLPAAAMRITLDPLQTIRPKEANLHLYLIQAMLLALHQLYENLPAVTVNGVFDEATEQAVLWMQKKAGLPETGVIDQIFWMYLEKLYCLAAGNGYECLTVDSSTES